ncbi:uncharacterized protein JCM15063_001978 [Sporobolomyces koalae]|uniref:uncharacterized protein n=1 Tax=Sporobolomyces koalae TaxID=500713 RepID=UPI00317C4F3D
MARPTPNPRFSFTRTAISELDIDWLLDHDTPTTPPSPSSPEFTSIPFEHGIRAWSPPSPTSSLLYNALSPYSQQLETPRPARTKSLSRSQRSEVPLSCYEFPPPADSRSSTPTPHLTPRRRGHHSSKLSSASTIMVELDDFFPHAPSTTFPFSLGHSAPRSPSMDQPSSPNPSVAVTGTRKGSLASSLFSTISSTSSQSSSSARSTTEQSARDRTRTPSNRSDRTDGSTGSSFEDRQPKLAAYPRYVPPKVKPEGPGSTPGRIKISLFGR